MSTRPTKSGARIAAIRRPTTPYPPAIRMSPVAARSVIRQPSAPQLVQHPQERVVVDLAFRVSPLEDLLRRITARACLAVRHGDRPEESEEQGRTEDPPDTHPGHVGTSIPVPVHEVISFPDGSASGPNRERTSTG